MGTTVELILGITAVFALALVINGLVGLFR
jgi:hypothetical protein